MKAYGFGEHRNGTKAHKFVCCDTRKGCSHNNGNPETATGKRVSREAKRRARATGKAACREALAE